MKNNDPFKLAELTWVELHTLEKEVTAKLFSTKERDRKVVRLWENVCNAMAIKQSRERVAQ